MLMPLKRKRIRLAPEQYRGRGIYFLTFCCEDRRSVFATARHAEWAQDRLCKSASLNFFLVHAWCVMPDHLHVLLQGTADACDVIYFAARFKQRTGFEARSRIAGPLWQTHFYDHIVKPNEPLERVAWYIWQNPVRKGMCAAPHLYPYSGSETMDWTKTSIEVEGWIPPWKKENL
jgi:putative transposase